MQPVETAAPVFLPDAPFLGIQPFGYSDHPIFFARAAEARALVRHIVVYRGVFLYGESGAGKSSLINAGLIPAAELEGLRADRIRVQPQAGGELVVERIRMTADRHSEFLPSSFADPLDRAAQIVLAADTFAERIAALPEGVRPLLVFDQFEELVTQFEEAPTGATRAEALAAQGRVVGLLVGLLADDALPVKLLFVFREDFLAKVRNLLAARPELMDQSLRLAPPAADALEEIVRGPFDAHPGRFEPELSPELSSRLIAAIRERAGSGEINLSEVQVVCRRLWESDDPEVLFAARGVEGLLEDYLSSALDAFGPLRLPAIALLSEMVTASGVRNVVSKDDLIARVHEEEKIDPKLLEDALAALEKETRLVRGEARRNLYLYEITSEFLVPWIRARQEEFVREREREKLAELEAQRTRERRNKAFRIAAVALVVVVAVLAGVTAYALSQRSDANKRAHEANVARAHADHAEKVASSQHLADVASSKAAIDPVHAQQIAAFAVTRSPTREALGALEETLTASQLRVSLEGDESPHDITFSPDGTLVATAGDDGHVRLWKASTGRQVGDISTGANSVLNVAFSPDGKLLAAAMKDSSAGVWDVASGHLVARLPRLRRFPVPNDGLSVTFVPFPSVAFNRDGSRVLSLAPDAVARLWDLKTKGPPRILRGSEDSVVNSATFSPDGKRILVASDGAAVDVWRPDRRRALEKFPASDQVARAAFTADGRRIVGVEADGSVRVWDERKRPSLVDHMFPPNESYDVIGIYVTSTAFSPDGRSAFSVLPDGHARLWRIPTRKVVTLGAGRTVVAAVFSPDSTLLVTTRVDGSAQLWDARTGERLAVLGGPSGLKGGKEQQRRLYAAAFSADGRRIAVTGPTGARIFVVRRSLASRRIRGVGAPLSSAQVSGSGGVVVADTDRGAVVQQLSGSRRRVFRNHPGDFSLSADGRFAVTPIEGGFVVWNTATGRTVKGFRGVAGVGVVSPDGRRFFTSAGSVGHLLTRGERPLRLRTDARSIDAAAFSDDGRLLATGGSDGFTRVWDAKGQPVIDLMGGNGAIRAVRFSPDGTRLVTVSADGTVVVRGMNDGLVVRALSAGRPVSAALSPARRFALTVDRDGTVRLWDLTTGSVCAVYGDAANPILAADFDKSGRIVTIDRRGIVRTEGLGLCARAARHQLPSVARDMVRPLTAKELEALLRGS